MVTALKQQNLSHAGIGASEIAAICGLNPFASPWDVWLRKTGQSAEFEGNAFTEWGHRLEPAIRQKYADDTSSLVHVPRESLFSSERAWARATPDGIVLTGPDDRAWSHLLQCKNVGTWVGKSWDDAPPVYVQLQEQWEMYVTGLARADVAALIGGSDYRVFTVHRDDKAIGDLLTIADDFWKKVESRTPPAVDESDACRQHFESRIKGTKVEVVADEQTDRLFHEWRDLTMQAKATKKRIETIRNLVRQQLAEADAHRILSSIGAASYSKPTDPEPVSETDWEHVARLLGSAKCSNDEFAELVAGATTTVTPNKKTPTLYAPREWGKETP